ncbi:hypothetical protein AOLI_G00216980 [Acnodon oligacanthus]
MYLYGILVLAVTVSCRERQWCSRKTSSSWTSEWDLALADQQKHPDLESSPLTCLWIVELVPFSTRWDALCLWMGSSLHAALYSPDRVAVAVGKAKNLRGSCPPQFLQLIPGDSKTFPGQLGDIIPPASPRTTLGSCPGQWEMEVAV